MASVLAGEVKVGNIINYEGGKYRILKRTHVKPGKGGAFYQFEMKEITVGTKKNERIRSEDRLEKLETSQKEYSFLYKDVETLHLMDNETFEQIEVNVDMVGELAVFLEEDMILTANYAGEDLVSVSLPQKLIGEVAETEPYIKNAAVSPSYKTAKLTNGFVLDIPPYLENGVKIVINSETLEFVEKYKEA